MRSPNKASNTRAESLRRHTSFGSTQAYHTTQDFAQITTLDRETNKRKVQRSLNLGEQKLRDAEWNRDDPAAYRLRRPNLFDDIEKPEAEDEGLEKGGSGRSQLRPSVIYETEPLTSTMAGDLGFTSHHTAQIMNVTFAGP